MHINFLKKRCENIDSETTKNILICHGTKNQKLKSKTIKRNNRFTWQSEIDNNI